MRNATDKDPSFYILLIILCLVLCMGHWPRSDFKSEWKRSRDNCHGSSVGMAAQLSFIFEDWVDCTFVLLTVTAIDLAPSFSSCSFSQLPLLPSAPAHSFSFYYSTRELYNSHYRRESDCHFNRLIINKFLSQFQSVFQKSLCK